MVRWLALAVMVLAPVTVLVIFVRHRLLWVALAAIAPRNRPGIRPPRPALDWPTLRQLASFRSAPAGTG